jgi:hypothetical protein
MVMSNLAKSSPGRAKGMVQLLSPCGRRETAVLTHFGAAFQEWHEVSGGAALTASEGMPDGRLLDTD